MAVDPVSIFFGLGSFFKRNKADREAHELMKAQLDLETRQVAYQDWVNRQRVKERGDVDALRKFGVDVELGADLAGSDLENLAIDRARGIRDDYGAIGEEQIMIKDMVLHPSYSRTFGRIKNDIGLIFLECDSNYEPATIGCVEWMYRYQNITTVGYSFGYKKYSKPNVFRYFGTVVEEPNYMKFIPRPASVWPGDSAGGVFAKFMDKNYVVGIISNYIVIETFNGRIVVSECSATIIVKYLDWIETEIKDENGQVIKTVEDGR